MEVNSPDHGAVGFWPQPGRGAAQVLLLQPWVEDFYFTDCRVQPIGLAYLAGSLKRKFPYLDVRIFDTLAGGRKKTIPWPPEFSYLKTYYGAEDHGPFSLFHQYYRFGLSEEDILRRLADYQPFLIGISCLFTPYYRQSLQLARLCRRLFPETPIVMGGNHATMHPETLLFPARPFAADERLCDYVLRGEGEQSICELVEHLLGQRNLAEVSNLVVPAAARPTFGEWIRPAPDAPLPQFLSMPDLDSLDPQNYRFGKKPMSFLITSRSCPHHCSFCSIHAVFGDHYTHRPVDEVLEEIRLRCAQEIRHFDIEDDNFTFNKAHALQLLDRIVDAQLPVTFSAMNGLSYLSLDRELLGKMKRAGFDSVNISLVSSDAPVLELSRRPHSLQKFREVLEVAAEMGFRVTAYGILGMPGQTVEQMWFTLRVLAESQCLIGASPFYFTPGSPIHTREKDRPDIQLASRGKDPCFSARLSALDLECADFSRDDVYTCFRMARVINYIKAGVDLGYPPAHGYFIPAAEVLAEGAWYAECKKTKVPLPFSPVVRDLMRQVPLSVCGYKTPRRIAWNPECSRWEAPSTAECRFFNAGESTG